MNINELLKEEIVEVSEDENNYYVSLKPSEQYDDTVWKVNKNTKKVEWASYVSEVVIRGLENVNIELFKNSMV